MTGELTSGQRDESALKRRVAESTRWSLAASLGNQVLRIGGVVVLARILGPASYGILGQAAIYLSLSMLFLDVGIGTAVIQKPDLDRQDLGTAAFLNLVVSFVVIVSTWLLSPWVADFLRTPELESLLRVLSFGFVLSALSVAPSAMMVRDLELGRLGAIEVVATVCGVGAGVVAALAGADYWALAYQTFTRDLVLVVLLLTSRGLNLRPARKSIGVFGWFGANVFGTQLLQFLVRNGDDLLVARYLGSAAIGYYSLSYRVVILPLQVLGSAASRITLPTFSRLTGEPDRLLRYYRESLALLLFVAGPLLTLVIVNAPVGIPFVFGEEWEAAVLPTQILSYASLLMLLSMSSNAGVLYGFGKAKWGLYWQIATAVPSFIAYAIGLHWDVAGVSYAVALMITLSFVAEIVIMTSRLIPVTLGQVAITMMPATVSALVLAGAWHAGVAVLPSGAPPLLEMFVGSTAGVIAFGAVFRLVFSDQLESCLGFVRQVLGRSGDVVAPASGLEP